MIYINGTNGRIGRYVYKHLSSIYDICKVSSKITDTNSLYCDLTSPDLYFCRNIHEGDYFIFLAACGNPSACKDVDIAFNINVHGTERVIRKLLSKKVRVIFSSSNAVYGEGTEDRKLYTEEFPLYGDTTYAVTKIRIENTFKTEQDFKVIRLTFVLTAKSPVLEYFRQCAGKGEIAQAYKGGVVSWVSVYDVAEIISGMIDRWDDAPKVMNVCGLESADKAELAHRYQQCVNSAFKYEAVAPPADFAIGRVQNCPTSAEKMLAFYGRNPLSLNEALLLEHKLSIQDEA